MSEEAVESPQSVLEPYITENGLPVGPLAGVEYPITVVYCGNCGLPTEVWTRNNIKHFHSQFNFAFIVLWILRRIWKMQTVVWGKFAFRVCKTSKNKYAVTKILILRMFFISIMFYIIAGDDTKEGEDDKKRQKRGGRGLSKPKKKDGGPKRISLGVAPRGRKRLTLLCGLKSYGLKFCLFLHRILKDSSETLWLFGISFYIYNILLQVFVNSQDSSEIFNYLWNF